MGKKATVPDNVDDDDALDMFAENLDGDKKKEEVAAAPVKEDPVLDDVSLGVNRFLYMFRGRSRWAGSLSGSLRMWNCMGLTPVKRCLTGRWETLNDSLTWIYTLFFPLRILTIQKSSHSISPGVWLLWRGDSRQKSWHRGVQGFKEDWFWALCLASFLDYNLFCKLGILCTYWRDNPVSYLSTFQRNECTANLRVLPALWWREEDHEGAGHQGASLKQCHQTYSVSLPHFLREVETLSNSANVVDQQHLPSWAGSQLSLPKFCKLRCPMQRSSPSTRRTTPLAIWYFIL